MGIGRIYTTQAAIEAKRAQELRTLEQTVTTLTAVCLEAVANPGAMLPAIIAAIDAALTLKNSQSERKLEAALAPLGWTMDELAATMQRTALAHIAA